MDQEASDSLYARAIDRFLEIFGRAQAHEAITEPTAMTLATAGRDGRLSARTVLLKHCDRGGFVLYTNTLSRKGRQLAENPRAALTFFWAPLHEQVLVEGHAVPVSDDEADAYFATRPRLSRLGAWASQQSQPLDSRAALEARLAALEEAYRDAEIPRPPHWSGYRVVPDMIEFWKGRQGRLHERDRYWLDGDIWRHTLLNP